MPTHRDILKALLARSGAPTDSRPEGLMVGKDSPTSEAGRGQPTAEWLLLGRIGNRFVFASKAGQTLNGSVVTHDLSTDEKSGPFPTHQLTGSPGFKVATDLEYQKALKDHGYKEGQGLPPSTPRRDSKAARRFPRQAPEEEESEQDAPLSAQGGRRRTPLFHRPVISPEAADAITEVFRGTGPSTFSRAFISAGVRVAEVQPTSDGYGLSFTVDWDGGEITALVDSPEDSELEAVFEQVNFSDEGQALSTIRELRRALRSLGVDTLQLQANDPKSGVLYAKVRGVVWADDQSRAEIDSALMQLAKSNNFSGDYETPAEVLKVTGPTGQRWGEEALGKVRWVGLVRLDSD